MKRIIAILCIFVLSLTFLTSCGTKKTDNNNTSTSGDEVIIPSDAQNPIVTMTMKDGAVIKIELYYNKAPNTVTNFIYLANKGFYDGLIFHRIIKGFMIQGGDPEGNGYGNPGYSIKGEFINNGFDNDLTNSYGTIAMARGSHSMDSAGSQFYINVAENTSLDGNYAVFGQVIEGMDTVLEYSKVETDSNDKPLSTITIKSVTVETYGVNYGEPERV